MTYREIFLHADPHTVNDLFCCKFTYPYRTEQAFSICKGLKFYAQGMRLDVPEEEEVQKILNHDVHEPPFKWTRKQAQIFAAAKRGWLRAACEALGFNNAPNPDELVNEWLDQTTPDDSAAANLLAVNIISILIKKYNERFKS